MKISREMLQQNKILQVLRKNLTMMYDDMFFEIAENIEFMGKNFVTATKEVSKHNHT